MRVKRGRATRKRHKKVLSYTKGFVGSKSKLFRSANQALMKAWRYAYKHRRQKKRDFRRLWQIKIGAAAKDLGISYSRLIHNLKQKNIEIDRKILAGLAEKRPEIFKEIVEKSK